jgi:hypothetical protein
MSKTFLTAFSIGIVCIAIAVGGVLYMQRGAHIDPQVKVLKVRTAPLDENSSLVVVDFRIANTSDYPFKVRGVTVVVSNADGSKPQGQTVSETDAKQVFAGIPVLGTKYNDSLIMNDMLPAHKSWDRMIAARFEMPEATLQARKNLIVQVEEVDGLTVNIPEK